MGEPDTERPNSYRIYDYLLGGSANFAADRSFARELLEKVPWAREVAGNNRAFLSRAVRFAVADGIRQFLDLGSGIPTVTRIDRVARSVDPGCRVAYIDANPLAVAHAELLLDGEPSTAVAQADLRNVPGVLAEPAVAGLLDLARPVVLVLGAVLHFVEDSDDPAGIVAGYRDALAPGSVLVLSHATYDDVPAEIAKGASMYRATAETITDRSRAEITALFDGWDLVEPGVVFTGEWRTDYPESRPAEPGRDVFLAGVARKPG